MILDIIYIFQLSMHFLSFFLFRVLMSKIYSYFLFLMIIECIILLIVIANANDSEGDVGWTVLQSIYGIYYFYSMIVFNKT